MISKALAIMAAAFAAGIAPDPVVVPHEWAREHVTVPDGPYARAKWSPTVAPYLVEILDKCSPADPCTRITVEKSAQTGFTGVGTIFAMLCIATAPDNILIVQPTTDAAKDYVRNKLNPAIEACDPVATRVLPQTSRSGMDSTMLSKRFPGGYCRVGGANSAASLSSHTARFTFRDEIDRWPRNLANQGSPQKMVDARQLSFRETGTDKSLEISTPTEEGDSPIHEAYEAGDRRTYHVPCPQCGAMQKLEWERLEFNDTVPHGAHYVCAENGCVISHAHKARMLAHGRWVAEMPGPGRHPSYHIDALYSPFVSWDDVAHEWVLAKGDVEALKAFTNLWLGRPFRTEGDAPRWADLKERAGAGIISGPGTVPSSALILTMGVDVQADRLEASIWGWGVGRTSYLINHVVLEGDTLQLAVWQALGVLHATPIAAANGQQREILQTAVDAGFRPQMTYDWVRGRPNACAVKGYAGTMDQPIGKGRTIRYTRKGTADKLSVKLHMVGTDRLKREFYGALALEGPDKDGAFPPGFVHLASGLGDEVYRGLVAERLVAIEKRGGGVRYEWMVEKGVRNEPLDCAVYARAAAYRLGIGTFSAERWAALAASLGAPAEEAQLDLLRAVQAPRARGAEGDASSEARRPPAGNGRGGFLGGRGRGWLK